MRTIDKKNNLKRINILFERRYLNRISENSASTDINDINQVFSGKEIQKGDTVKNIEYEGDVLRILSSNGNEYTYEPYSDNLTVNANDTNSASLVNIGVLSNIIKIYNPDSKYTKQ